MCYRLVDEQLDQEKKLGYNNVLDQMLPGGRLFDREHVNRWNRLALAEENDECATDHNEDEWLLL